MKRNEKGPVPTGLSPDQVNGHSTGGVRYFSSKALLGQLEVCMTGRGVSGLFLEKFVL